MEDRPTGRLVLHAEKVLPADEVIEGRYRVLRPVGLGSFATTYASIDIPVGEQVALQLLHRRCAADTDALRRCESACIAAARVGGDRVVRLVDSGWLPSGAHYQLFDWAAGRRADRLLAERSIPSVLLLPMFDQVLETFALLHAEGVVHGRFSPGSVWVSLVASGVVRTRVAGFGRVFLQPPEGEEGQPAPDQPLTPTRDVRALGRFLQECLDARGVAENVTTRALYAVAERAAPADGGCGFESAVDMQETFQRLRSGKSEPAAPAAKADLADAGAGRVPTGAFRDEPPVAGGRSPFDSAAPSDVPPPSSGTRRAAASRPSPGGAPVSVRAPSSAPSPVAALLPAASRVVGAALSAPLEQSPEARASTGTSPLPPVGRSMAPPGTAAAPVSPALDGANSPPSPEVSSPPPSPSRSKRTLPLQLSAQGVVSAMSPLEASHFDRPAADSPERRRAGADPGALSKKGAAGTKLSPDEILARGEGGELRPGNGPTPREPTSSPSRTVSAEPSPPMNAPVSPFAMVREGDASRRRWLGALAASLVLILGLGAGVAYLGESMGKGARRTRRQALQPEAEVAAPGEPASEGSPPPAGEAIEMPEGRSAPGGTDPGESPAEGPPNVGLATASGLGETKGAPGGPGAAGGASMGSHSAARDSTVGASAGGGSSRSAAGDLDVKARAAKRAEERKRSRRKAKRRRRARSTKRGASAAKPSAAKPSASKAKPTAKPAGEEAASDSRLPSGRRTIRTDF